jgi:TPP-dependent pyruvate/acetoin dehydrogenase alpha subunit
MGTATGQRANLEIQVENWIKMFRQMLAMRLFEERVNELPFSPPLEGATVPTEQSLFEAARELCGLADGA